MLHHANRIEFHCGVPFGLSRRVDRLWLGLPGEVGVLGNEVHMNREVRRGVTGPFINSETIRRAFIRRVVLLDV
jgi:hypothetical protein